MAIRKVTIEEISGGQLYGDLMVASHHHAYSVCVEYIKNWFLDKCPKNFFKDESIYVDGSHIFTDMVKLSRRDIIKRQPPNLTVIPELDSNFNNENLDLNGTKLKAYIKRTSMEKAFFIDHKNNIRVGVNFELIKMNTTYRIRLRTKAQQLDLYQRLKLALGQTSGQYISTDIHVPYELLLQVAQHAGFKVDVTNRKIYDIQKFIVYLNSNSAVPFIYKLRYVNGREEFFIRISDVYIHTRVTDVNIDNGERVGQLTTNYTIEVSTETRFPAPQVYILYSMVENKLIAKLGEEVAKDDNITFINTFRLTGAPDLNEKGWNKIISTDVVEKNLTEKIDINFTPLFSGSDIERVIKYTKDIKISPATFLEIRILNDGRYLPLDIDWDTLDVKAKELHTDPVSSAIIYMDLNYYNSALIVIDELEKSRVK